ncbi:MAG: four helix bundle protein [Deltaproteobacteria bacterium]|nr:four helix bundle protein [Deltaproteobacteria bacterium]
MTLNHEILAFRRSESLTLQIFQATDRFPKQAPPALVHRLRQLTSNITDSILDGCARHHREAAESSWNTALKLLEALADGIDEADGRGLLDPDTVLQLLQSQSATWVEVLCMVREADPSRFRDQDSRAA